MVKESLRAGCAVNLIKLALHFIRNHFIWIILLVLSQTVRICYLFLNFMEFWKTCINEGRVRVKKTKSLMTSRLKPIVLTMSSTHLILLR